MQRIDNPPNNLFEDGNEYTGKVGTIATGSWLNGVQEEPAKVIEEAGLTLDENDRTQLWQALLRRFDWWRLETATITFVNATSFKVDGDVTGIYVQHRAVKLTQTSDDKGYVASSSFSAGETTVTVTGCTVDSGLSAVEYGQELLSEPFNSAANEVKRGYQDGMILSNAAGDTAHDISVSAGAARDDVNTFSIINAAAIIKQIDAPWALGSNAGGFPSGLTLSADTWYHFFVIAKLDETVDAGYDTSLTAANLLADATGFVKYRYRGSVLVDASANIMAFHQFGNKFIWDDPIFDFNELTGITEVTKTIRVPPGISATVNFNINNSGGISNIYIRHPDTTDIAPALDTTPLAVYANNNQNINGLMVKTNQSSQIKYRSTANNTLKFCTISYSILRGKDE